ncbi:MAG: T9SS type A sorting domain-containing protein [Chitinophagaceae bacterium]
MLSKFFQVFIVSFSIFSPLFAQENEIPLIGIKHINPWMFIEKGSNYYFTTATYGNKRAMNGGDRPKEIIVQKCNIATHQIVSSLHLIGDTVQTDSVISGFEQLSCSLGDKIFYLFNEYFPDDTVENPHPVNGIVFASIDTNLNIVVAPMRIKSQYSPQMGRFDGCAIQSFTPIGNRLVVGYVSGDSAFKIVSNASELSRYLILDQNGIILKDSVAGTVPAIATNTAVYHQLAEIIPYTDGKLLLTGRGIHNYGMSSKSGFALVDSNMHVLDTFAFKFDDYLSANYIGYYPQFPNSVVLPSRTIILGRDFYTVNSAGNQTGIYVALAKLSIANRYNADTIAVFSGLATVNLQNSTPSLLNLGYNKIDKSLYYAFTDGRVSPAYAAPCNDTLNHVCIISVDTNLHLKWQKYVSPANHSCSYVSRIAVSDARTGIDVIGYYTDATNSNDTNLQGSFIYHMDSTGTLDVIDQNKFTIRDRFRVFPNPTSDIVSVDDVLQSIESIDVYNMQGALILRKPAGQGQTSISLATQPSGLYVLCLFIKDGTHYLARVLRD